MALCKHVLLFALCIALAPIIMKLIFFSENSCGAVQKMSLSQLEFYTSSTREFHTVGHPAISAFSFTVIFGQ